MEDDITEVKAIDADDPNVDLIGYEFTISTAPMSTSGETELPGTKWKVTRTAPWSEGTYVEIVNAEGDLTSVRATGLVRNRMHAETDAELIGHAQDARDALDAD